MKHHEISNTMLSIKHEENLNKTIFMCKQPDMNAMSCLTNDDPGHTSVSGRPQNYHFVAE